jgi:hypothetical protein
MFSYLLQTVVGQFEASEQHRMILREAQINLTLTYISIKRFIAKLLTTLNLCLCVGDMCLIEEGLWEEIEETENILSIAFLRWK